MSGATGGDTSAHPRIYDRRRGNWYWTDNAFIDEFAAKLDHVGSHEIAVYGILCRHADKEGVAFPSVTYMARIIGKSDNTVRAALKNLGRARLVRSIPRYRPNGSQLPNDYELQDVHAALERSGDPPQILNPPPSNSEEAPPQSLNPKNTHMQENPKRNAPQGAALSAPGKDGSIEHLAKHYMTLTIDRMRELEFDPTKWQRANLGRGFDALVAVPEGQEPPTPAKIMAVVTEILASAKAGYYLGVTKAVERLDKGGAANKRRGGGTDGKRPVTEGYEWLFGDDGEASSPVGELVPLVPEGQRDGAVLPEVAAILQRRITELADAGDAPAFERACGELSDSPWISDAAKERILERARERAGLAGRAENRGGEDVA